jgi:hypothetical protein
MPGSSGFLLDQIHGLDVAAWSRFRLDDGDVALGEQLVGVVGTQFGNELFVVTDASWRQDVGPFALPTWHLNGLIREHAELAGESFFASDVVLLSPDEGVLAAVHRAGLIAVVRGVPSPRETIWPLAHLTDSTVFADWKAPLEWAHLFGEIYPDAAVTLPSGRTVTVRWFETDPQVSFTAPTGDFQVSYRGPVEDLDQVFAELLGVLGAGDREVMRLPAQR